MADTGIIMGKVCYIYIVSLMYFPAVAAEAQLNEEFEMQKISEYTDPENWVHHIPYILPQVSLQCLHLTHYNLLLSLPSTHNAGADSVVESVPESRR